MAKYKVLVTARSFGNADSRALDLLEGGGCSVKKLTAGSESVAQQLKREIVDADAVIAGLDEFSAELIESAPMLKVISRYGVGYDKVDVAAASKRSIPVTITPGANGDSVADLAVALILDCARNVTFMNNSLKSGSQERPEGLEIWEKTLGVVGAGRIGKGVARRCRGFSMKILCYDTYQDELFRKEVGAQYVDFETLVRESDFITLHSPLTPETENMFGAKEFHMMKNTAVLVNTARGGIVDEDALYKALKAGEIRAAGLDATLAEPPSGSPLTTLPNCILTPHAGAATAEASSKMSLMAAQNVLDVLGTGACKFAVNSFSPN